jgi:iron complex outermembrane receptor protein|tara:strand:+ start:2548 stop:4746 length:2199 start_codon:yes stop_codon:yes gene_type:complete
MVNKIKYLSILFLFSSQLYSQELDSIKLKVILDQVSINAIRANKKAPFVFTNLSKSEINQYNHGQDLPYLISLTPSVVTTSDAGAGIGYTGLRIRGTDLSRINITVNGIPLNDSESQGVWWVNMPDFASSIDNIQIQRGVGTSTNGAAAFGASINLKTMGLNKKPYTITSNTIGSYNTLKNNIEFGSGLISNNFSFDARLSRIASDGYIDKASSDLKSLYVQGSYFREKSVLKGIIFSGNERTYQAWNGVPQRYLDTNRTYNSYNYENEIDNYNQTHYQLHYSEQINSKTNVNFASHYTHGEGYYEQKKLNQNFSNYNLDNIIIGNDTITSTDLIRRKWLKNDFSGIIYSIKHNSGNINLTMGGANSIYSGQHYGNIIWAEYTSNSQYNHEYYRNIATKYDNNIYFKTNYQASSKTSLFIDLQNRNIDYEFNGNDINGNNEIQHIKLDFFNPKFGFTQKINNQQLFYSSFAIASKEPNRSDYVDSSPNSRPKHETLYDTEVGFRYQNKKIRFNTNVYLMNYDNQLIKTGEINDVGYFTSTNIKKSFRRGIEIEGSYIINTKFSCSANLTFSQNKLDTMTQFIDNWDTGIQEAVKHKNTDLSFSPNITWASQLSYKINNNTSLNFVSKYVGEQYIDNTSSDDRKLDDYLISNLQLDYNFKSKIFNTAKISILINNIFDNKYVGNAWLYRFISEDFDPRDSDHYVTKDSDTRYNMAGYFPQATRNYLFGLTLGF